MPESERDNRPLVVWVTTGYPPEVSGPAVGNDDRARWFARNGSVRVVVLAPQWPGAMESTPATGDQPEVVRYESRPWPPYQGFRVPTRAGARHIEDTVARLAPSLVLLTDVERSFAFGAWRLPARAWSRRAGVPYLAYYHTDFYNFAGMYPLWRALRDVLIRPGLRALYRRVDAAICPSPAAAAQALALHAPRAYAMRFDGVDTERFTPERRDRAVLTKYLPGDRPEAPVVLSLGRLAWEKRVDLVIEAVGRLQRRPELANVRLVVAGDGDDAVVGRLRRVAAAIPHPDQVHFVGPVLGEDKADLMASCDALCLASPYETFGITVTEAMASGLPVVASDSGALSDYLVDGRNSFLHEQEDVASIAHALSAALLHDTAAVTEQARVDVQQFSMDGVARGLDAFLAEVIGSGRLPRTSLTFSATATGQADVPVGGPAV